LSLKKIISLFLYCLLFQEAATALICDPSPEIKCVSVAPNGNVTISWQNPAPLLNFNKYFIYSSRNINGPYSVVDSIFNPASTSYTHVGTNANGGEVYYYIVGNCGGTINAPAVDTISSIFLNATNPGNGTVMLKWNALHKPSVATSMSWYRVFREYPAGTWTLVDSTKSLSFIDTVSVCRTQLNYRIETGDNTGCTSVSSIAGGVFMDMIVPKIPFLDSVSVNVAGKVDIGWEPSASGDTQGYVVYQLINGIWVSIDTVVGRNNTFYTNLNASANSTIENYRIAAFDSCGKHLSPMGTPHNTILVKSNPNPCARLNVLNWNAYNSMPSGIKEYDIYVSINGAPFVLLGTTASGSTSFTHTNLQQTFVYCYFVQAKDMSGTRSSTSNKYCYTANIPPEPTFSYLKSATVIANNMVNVYCYVDVAAQIKKYKILRSESPAGPFVLIGSTPFTGAAIVSYTDKTAKTSEKSYYYKTVAVDTCNNDTTVTNIGRTILLNVVANDDRTNTLSWNDYELWLGSVNSYNVYRSIDGGAWVGPIANIPYTATGSNTFTDDVSNYYPGQGIFSYYVKAFEDVGNPYGITDSSRSNVAEALQDAKVYIPNAFVPTGKNNLFIPVTAYVDKTEYVFRIFDRWGEEVFVTNDPYQAWDGTVGGKKADENVYVYLLKFKTAYGQYVERKGTVALLR
jgi:gliding motility-associated-like protein